MKKNYVLLFLFCVVIGAGIIIGYYEFQKKDSSNTISSSTKETPTLSLDQAPSNSIRGTIESMSGVVEWESRTATEPAQITKNITLQQGEELVTKDLGHAEVIFPNVGSINLSPQSDISFIQTLPTNFVFQQSKGLIEYIDDSETPISVRIFHLLTKMSKGTMKININSDSGIVTINMTKGSATVGFNDIDNISTVVNLEEGDQYTYNDDTRIGNIK